MRWICVCLLPLLAVPGAVSSDEGGDSVFSKASCDFAVDLLKSMSSATAAATAVSGLSNLTMTNSGNGFLLKSQSKISTGNLIASPSSVGTLLALLQQGAQEDTLRQLETVLHLTADQSRLGQNRMLKSLEREKRNVTLEWGNRAYLRPGLDIADAFNATIRESFGASVEELNFIEPSTEAAAATINSWVKEITHDNIKNLVAPAELGPDTLLILLNAIYFKGLWDLPFRKIDTREDAFELSPNNTVTVPFMTQKERFLAGEHPESGLLWVDLPFKDEQFSMLFLLPAEKHALDRLLDKLTGQLLLSIINDDSTRLVHLQLPKFKLKQKALLSKPLQELGLKDVFTEAANLQGIAQSANLKLSKIIHEAGIEIDETGGTAYAATGSLFVSFSSPATSDRLTFRADHPFLFFVLDRTNKVPLFAGKVADPS